MIFILFVGRIFVSLLTTVTEDVDKEMNIMFQRCKRNLNISFMGVVRGSRDRQNELFADVNKVLNENVKLLEQQVIRVFLGLEENLETTAPIKNTLLPHFC